MSNKPTSSIRVPASNGDDVPQSAEPTVSDTLNPYQPKDLWINPSVIHSGAAVKKILTTIPIRKPNKHEFFRVRAGEEYWQPVAFLELGRDVFLIHPLVVPHLDPDDFFYAYLCLAISRSGFLFFWPVKVPNAERRNTWNESALMVARLAVDKWIKLRSRQEDGRGGGFYEGEEPLVTFKDPVWPDLTLKELYDIAFKGGHIIDRIDHEAIQKLTGQVQ
jgi:hypothetical protein